MTKKSKGRGSLFLNAMTIGGGTYLGIAIVDVITSLIGLVIGYFIVKHARGLKKKDPKSDFANILEIIGFFIMFGPIAAFIAFNNMSELEL